jgi:hypothetical protein
MENYARFGYSLQIKMTHVLKRKSFARWQAGEKLPDPALCKAVEALSKALQSGVLLEVHCEQDH